MKEDYLDVDQVAEMLSISGRTVRHLVQHGKIPGAFKVSESRTSTWRIPKKGVEEYVQRQQSVSVKK